MAKPTSRPARWVQFSRDPQRQRRSRAVILAVADFNGLGDGDRFSARRYLELWCRGQGRLGRQQVVGLRWRV
jgi:hypothetical protein